MIFQFVSHNSLREDIKESRWGQTAFSEPVSYWGGLHLWPCCRGSLWLWSPLTMWLYSSAQYSVHLVRMSWASVSQFPFLSRMVLACPCFLLVKTFNSWYAFSLMLSWCYLQHLDNVGQSKILFFAFSWSSWFPGLLLYVFSSSVSFVRHKDSICQLWPTVFWPLGVCQEFRQLFSHCCIEGVIYIENGNRCLLCF